MDLDIEGRARGRARGKPISELDSSQTKPHGRGPSVSAIGHNQQKSSDSKKVKSANVENIREQSDRGSSRTQSRPLNSADKYVDEHVETQSVRRGRRGNRHSRGHNKDSQNYDENSMENYRGGHQKQRDRHDKRDHQRTSHSSNDETFASPSEKVSDQKQSTRWNKGVDNLTSAESLPGPRLHQRRSNNNRMLERDFGRLTVEKTRTQYRGRGRGNDGQSQLRRERDNKFDTDRTRPDYLTSKQGNSGTELTLTTNYFELVQAPDTKLFQYRTDFSLDDDRAFMKKALLRQHNDILPQYMFDGNSLLCFNRLYDEQEGPLRLMSKRLNSDGSHDDCRIVIRFVKEVSNTDKNYLQLLAIIQRQIMEKLDMELIGRNYFDPHSANLIREYCLELWPGYITSIRRHENGILMCAEITNKVIRTDTVYEQMGNIYNRRPNNYRHAVERALLGSIVMTRYNKKTYRIDGIDWTLNPESKFDCRGESKSYLHYYQERYNCTIYDPTQPLLVSRPKDKDRRSGYSGPIFLLPELCFMTGLTDEQRSDFRLTSSLTQWTRMNPNERVENLMKLSGKMHHVEKIRNELEAWNMQFAPKLLQLKGRLLPPEVVSLMNSVHVSSSIAEWKLQSGLFNPANINRWIMVYPERDGQKSVFFLEAMRRVAPGLGINLTEPRHVVLAGNRAGEYVRELTKLILDQPEMVFCVIPNDKGDQYAAIKKKCCIEQPVPSQVITVSKVLNKEKVYLTLATKVVTQMACKLGAEPWALQIPFKGAMVVGYDTYHDSSRRGESVGALVASVNDTFTRYFSTVDFHRDRTEMSNKIGLMFLNALQKYQQLKGCLPSRIFFYRDGVGDGQICHVIEHEVKRLKETARKLHADYDPKITYVIVSKRIHTRFLTGTEPGTFGNPLSGTIVDDVVTLQERYDFFLVSQCVRLGTVNPTSYNVILDQSGFQPDQLQRLTYKLTHLYFNYPGTVRVPAPCQYAHKLAFLTGTALHSEPSHHLSDLLYFL